jgi:hypothetical protein
MNHNLNLNRLAGLFQFINTASGKCAIFMKSAKVEQDASNNCDEFPELLYKSLAINAKLRNLTWSAPQKDRTRQFFTGQEYRHQAPICYLCRRTAPAPS